MLRWWAMHPRRAPAGINLQRLVNNRVALPLRWRDQDQWLTAQLGAQPLVHFASSAISAKDSEDS